jgi:hypothetical protein
MDGPALQRRLRHRQIRAGVAKNLVDQPALERQASVRRLDDEDRRRYLQQDGPQPLLAVAQRRLGVLQLADIVPRQHGAGDPSGRVADRPRVAQHRQDTAVRPMDQQRLIHPHLAGARGVSERPVLGWHRRIAAGAPDIPRRRLAQHAPPGQLGRAAPGQRHAAGADMNHPHLRPLGNADPLGDIGE